MKISVWDIFTIIVLLALLVVGIFVLNIFTNPNSSLNPFPPPTLPAPVVIPSQTSTSPALAATWTPATTEQNPPTVEPGKPTYTPSATPTGFIVPSWTPTATKTFTPTPTGSATATRTATATQLPPALRTGTAISVIFTTATNASVNKTLTAMPTAVPTSMPGLKSAREKSGIQSNVWQKASNNPTFLFDVTPSMFEYYVYWGRDPQGMDATNRFPIHHNSKTIEFTPPSILEDTAATKYCGAYYLRVMVSYATKSGSTINYSFSNWVTLFTFKYDKTTPFPPMYANTGISGVLRGIQNKSGSPRFDWTGVNGADELNHVWLEGDYIEAEDGTALLCSGIKSYNVYWGPDPQGVIATHKVTSPKFTPPTVKSNTAYFLRVQSVDKLDNKSYWRTVALDPGYNPVAPGYADPTLDEIVFYYDTVRPNNIDSLSEDHGYSSSDPFRNDRNPSYTWSGGQDPVGFNTSEIWGYEVIWSTKPDAKPSFVKDTTYAPLLSTSGTYFIRVRAMDWAGNVSPDWRQMIYRYDGIGPLGVTSVTESGGVKSNTYYTTPIGRVLHFSWDTSKLKDPGTAIDSSGIDPNIGVYFGTDPNGVPSNIQPLSDGTYDTDPVNTTGVYYLRILTLDNAGNTTVTTPFVYKFDTDSPGSPEISEINGVTSGVAQSQFKTPNFDWASVDIGSGIKGFYYCWNKGSSCTPTKFVTSGRLKPGSVSSGIDYYLEVYAVDNAGNSSGISEFIFRYDAP